MDSWAGLDGHGDGQWDIETKALLTKARRLLLHSSRVHGASSFFLRKFHPAMELGIPSNGFAIGCKGANVLERWEAKRKKDDVRIGLDWKAGNCGHCIIWQSESSF